MRRWTLVLLFFLAVALYDAFFVATSPQQDMVENRSTNNNNPETTVHKVAGLSCGKHGGPPDELAAEMVYWRDLPTDANYVSPYKHAGPEPKYLTFEPDEGGWNNIRMSMETAVTLAHATGRTLVLPPEQGMYLLHKNDEKQKNRFSFSDFFHFDSVASEHAGVEVISFQEFLEREVLTGHMLDKETGKPIQPPNNRTDWNGVNRKSAKVLDQWMRSFTVNPIWFFDDCLVGIPTKPGPEGPPQMVKWANAINEARPDPTEFFGRPVAVDAAPLERLRELVAHRKTPLCVYDETYQQAKVLHMMGDNKSGARLLVHFYAFLFFEDWRADLWTKRFVRDHLRYVDEIQCAAARVVVAMREKARENGNPDGHFDTMHIRRGDFQYKKTRIEAQRIYENARDVLVENSTIYIATDERNKAFFSVFHDHYHVYFLDDFSHLLQGVNTNFYGMLDQRIASRGRTFVGCWFSTFTGYINRMRGYHHQLAKGPGWEQGAINSYYYVPLQKKNAVREYRPIQPPMWAREFPVGWRDLDRGIEEISSYP